MPDSTSEPNAERPKKPCLADKPRLSDRRVVLWTVSGDSGYEPVLAEAIALVWPDATDYFSDVSGIMGKWLNGKGQGFIEMMRLVCVSSDTSLQLGLFNAFDAARGLVEKKFVNSGRCRRDAPPRLVVSSPGQPLPLRAAFFSAPADSIQLNLGTRMNFSAGRKQFCAALAINPTHPARDEGVDKVLAKLGELEALPCRALACSI